MSGKCRGWRGAAGLAALGLVAVGCGSGGGEPQVTTPTTVTVAPPPPSAPPTSATASTLPGAPRTTTTIPGSLGPGTASLSGTVSGPDGPVQDAVVRVERLVARTPAATDLRTDGTGSWSVDSILGGPYRVRAFLAPALGQVMPEVFFLGADERRNVNLTLTRFGDTSLTATIDPSPPVVDQPATLQLQVGNGRVGEDGSLSLDPRPAVRLQLMSTDGVEVEGSGIELTDGDGRASFRVRCTQQGTFQMSLSVGNGVTRFGLPPCAAGPAPPP